MSSEGSMLDLAEAVRFREQNPPAFGNSKFFMVADLSDYTQATPEAIEYLAKNAPEGCSFVVVGLAELNVQNAKALAGWDNFLCFTNLQVLDVEVSAILSEGGSQLCFEGLKAISPEVAGALAASDNLLHLELDSLTIEVANELNKHSHELVLVLKTPPSGQLLNVLCGHAGYRLHVTWERPPGSEPYRFNSPNDKKAFVVSRLYKPSGEWFENVYIGNPDYYRDTLKSHAEIIEAFKQVVEITELP